MRWNNKNPNRWRTRLGAGEPGSAIKPEDGQIACVGLEQDLSIVVADHVGEELIVAADRAKPLAEA
ncbi:hypothetical protein ASE05_29565 [Mesorhizobium sp. Root172]|nr:hypothetical protein ASE05_29565 [Mesorhizobium sp. Root172]